MGRITLGVKIPWIKKTSTRIIYVEFIRISCRNSEKEDKKYGMVDSLSWI